MANNSAEIDYVKALISRSKYLGIAKDLDHLLNLENADITSPLILKGYDMTQARAIAETKGFGQFSKLIEAKKEELEKYFKDVRGPAVQAAQLAANESAKRFREADAAAAIRRAQEKAELKKISNARAAEQKQFAERYDAAKIVNAKKKANPTPWYRKNPLTSATFFGESSASKRREQKINAELARAKLAKTQPAPPSLAGGKTRTKRRKSKSKKSRRRN